MRILAVAGSSGGHVFPAVGFLDDFKTAYPGTQTLLVLPLCSINKGFTTGRHPVCFISVQALSMKPSVRNISAALNFIKGFFESIIILARFKPDIVVGFGSIASIPVLVCAWLFRMTVMIHEQNVLPGRANRLLALVSDRIAVSFPQTAVYFAPQRSNVVWTGNPVRKSLVVIDKSKALDYFGLSELKRTILVMGGSQSSRQINFNFARMFMVLPYRQAFQVIHLCGAVDKQALEKEYAPCADAVRLISFLNDMQYAYSAADLALSRAGATTIAELMLYRMPAILIPYPYAYGHQNQNALMLQSAGCAVIVTDANLAEGGLRNALDTITQSRDGLGNMKGAFDRFSADKPLSLVDEAIKIHSYG